MMRCERCLAKDGEKHPCGGFEVELQEKTTDGDTKFLCQRCIVRVQTQDEFNMRPEKNFFQKAYHMIFH
jgi:hypothetical protein